MSERNLSLGEKLGAALLKAHRTADLAKAKQRLEASQATLRKAQGVRTTKVATPVMRKVATPIRPDLSKKAEAEREAMGFGSAPGSDPVADMWKIHAHYRH